MMLISPTCPFRYSSVPKSLIVAILDWNTCCTAWDARSFSVEAKLAMALRALTGEAALDLT